MSDALLLVVLALGTARLTRLVNDDEIFAPVRRWSVRRWGETGIIPYLLHCRWCAGLWVSLLMCSAAWLLGQCSLPVAILFVPAVAYAAQLIRSMIEE